jgi:hypothetical protein
MGRLTRAIVAMLSAAALMLPADAQQQGSTITLSCNGTGKLTATAAADLKPRPDHEPGHHRQRGQSHCHVYGPAGVF